MKVREAVYFFCGALVGALAMSWLLWFAAPTPEWPKFWVPK